MKLKALAVALMGLTIATPSIARTVVEVGSEYDHYYDEYNEDKNKYEEYSKGNAIIPYIRFTHAPNDNSWNIWGRYFKKEYTNADPSVTPYMTDRYELHYTKVDRIGDIRFRYGVGVRHNGYEVDRHETEYRFYPQFDYFINSNNQLYLNGHYYIGDGREKRSGDKESQDYVDWGYEAEFGLIHKINAVSSIKPSIFTEHDSFENREDTSMWQARLVYTHKIGKMTVNPFIRYGISRETTLRSHVDSNRWGQEINRPYTRAGVYGNYGVSGRVNIVYETYWQVDENEYIAGSDREPTTLPDKDKFFAKLGVQYVF